MEIAVGYNAALSNQTKGVCVGGRGGSPLQPTDHIQTITIATTGTASTDYQASYALHGAPNRFLKQPFNSRIAARYGNAI